MGQRELLGQWKYFGWYYNGGYKSLLSPILQNGQYQDWTMAFGWWCCVNISSPIIANAPLWWGDVDNREAMHVWRQRFMKSFVSSAEYYCESKTVLKISLLCFKGQWWVHQRLKCTVMSLFFFLLEKLVFTKKRKEKKKWPYKKQNKVIINQKTNQNKVNIILKNKQIMISSIIAMSLKCI